MLSSSVLADSTYANCSCSTLMNFAQLDHLAKRRNRPWRQIFTDSSLNFVRQLCRTTSKMGVFVGSEDCKANTPDSTVFHSTELIISMMLQRYSLLALAISLLSFNQLAGQPAIWKSTNTSWATGSSWSTGSVPTAGNTAVFNSSADASLAVAQPNYGINSSVTALVFANNQQLGGWTMTGNGALQTASSTNTTLATYGPATYTINGPMLSGQDTSNLLSMNITNGSTLQLSGNTAITGNQGNINISGGTLRLDNSGANIPARVLNSGTLILSGGGLFELIGNSSGTTTNVGNLSAGSNVIGGVNVFRINSSAGGATVLNFANSAAGFTTRPGTRAVYVFEATTGNLGDAAGARVTFAGSPHLGANGLLGNTAGGGTVGYAIVRDAGGTDFATWNATNGVVRAGSTQTGTTAANLQSYTANDRVQFNPTINQTATGTITNGSIRISPGASGLSLTLGANNLATNALMLDGANNFEITANATSIIGGTGTRYIYVNNPNTVLTIGGLQVANGANPTTFAGPGFVDLAGTASQNTLTTTNRFVIAGGVVRGNNVQIGFTSSGAGIISLTGGILEIKNGSNGGGTSSDFTRSLGAAASNVTWGAASANEQGSGGFSAFGSAASVNIGGNATPTTLQWNSANFVGDGYALKFGSTKSNAVLTFLNPIQLDNGTVYQQREINVTAGVGGDRTVLSGVISGASNADFIKTGNGTLELNNTANTYTGQTLVAAGELRLTGNISTSSRTLVGATAILSGTGTVGATTVLSGGTIRGDSGTGTGTLITGNVTLQSGATIATNIAASGTESTLTLGANTLNLITGSRLALTAVTGFVNTAGGTYTIASLTSSSSLQLDGTTAADAFVFGTYVQGTGATGAVVIDPTGLGTLNAGDTLTLSRIGNNLVLTFAPVPEPMTVLGVSVLALGAFGFARRRMLAQA